MEICLFVNHQQPIQVPAEALIHTLVCASHIRCCLWALPVKRGLGLKPKTDRWTGKRMKASVDLLASLPVKPAWDWSHRLCTSPRRLLYMRLHECEALEKQSDTQEDMKRMQEWQRDAERVGGKRFHPCVPAFLGERWQENRGMATGHDLNGSAGDAT